MRVIPRGYRSNGISRMSSCIGSSSSSVTVVVVMVVTVVEDLFGAKI